MAPEIDRQRQVIAADDLGGRPYLLACATCDWQGEGFRYQCPVCEGPVLAAPAPPADDSHRPRPGAGLWRHAHLIPASRARVSLGEAGTPLVDAPGAALSQLGWNREQRIVLKLESLNPTLSFKDRAMALASSIALDGGLGGLVVASTGNAAVSAAAYAAAAGLACRVIVGSSSRATFKVAAARSYGADIEEIDGDYSTAYARAKAAEAEGWMNVSTTYRNPLLAEAYRPIAFELLDELGVSPAAVIVPVGAGPLLRGIERGFGDARELGLIDRVPRMIAVQAAAVQPVVDEWLRATGRSAGRSGARPARTLATAIADPLRGYESHGVITVEAVLRSQGCAVALNESSIREAHAALTRLGFAVEPSSATAWAALRQPLVRELVSAGPPRPVVVMLTGHAGRQSDAELPDEAGGRAARRNEGGRQ